jgi:hypothetical protein
MNQDSLTSDSCTCDPIIGELSRYLPPMPYLQQLAELGARADFFFKTHRI